MIKVLWPTIRLETMRKAWEVWKGRAFNEADIQIRVAVNSIQEAIQMERHGFKDILVVGQDCRGACKAVFQLGRYGAAESGDIIVVASDDFVPPQYWDVRLHSEFDNFDGALLVNDGLQYGLIMTIPIMSYACLLKINRILNHPDYVCQWADKELHDNLEELGLIRNLRKDPHFIFEHQHWTNGKRPKDDYDRHAAYMVPKDKRTYERRMLLPIIERLKP